MMASLVSDYTTKSAITNLQSLITNLRYNPLMPGAHIALNAHLLVGRARKAYRSAGIHQYIDNLLRCLPAADSDFRYTVFVGEGQPEMNGTRAAVRRTALPTIRPSVRIFWEQFVQPFELMRARPDLLHSLAFVSPLVNPCPAVVTVYDPSFRLFPGLPGAKGWLYHDLFRIVQNSTLHEFLFFFLMIRRPPRSTLFPAAVVFAY